MASMIREDVLEKLKREDILNMQWAIRGGKPKLEVLIYDYDRNRKRLLYTDFPFKPYCFIRESDKNKLPGALLKRIEDMYVKIYDADAVTYDRERVSRLEFLDPSQTKQLRIFLKYKGINLLEADIPYVRRVMTDLDLECSDYKRALFFDLEADPRGGFPLADKADKRIVSIAAVDREGNEFFICHEDERQIIKEFFNLSLRYQMLSGWMIRQFDIPYLLNRASKLGIQFDEFYLPALDCYQLYRTMLRKSVRSYKLADVAERELGVTKEDLEETLEMEEIWRRFVEDRRLLRKYNLGDARLATLIDKKFGLVDLHVSQAKLTHTLPHKVTGRMAAIDSIILNQAIKEKPRTIFPTKKPVQKGEDYTGAYVMHPVQGIHDNVIVIDFTSIYNRIFQTFNIGLETYRADKSGDIKAIYGSFITDKESLFSKAVKILEKSRKYEKSLREKCDPSSEEWRIHDKRQFACKTLLVSCYGVVGSPMSRYYKREIAENITGFTKILLKLIKGQCESLGFQVLYSDTDSIFIKPTRDLEEDIVSVANKLTKQLEDRVSRFSKSILGVMELKIGLHIAKIYRSLYLPTVKKRYAGYVMHQEGKSCDYLHIMGLEYKRSDFPPLVGEIQEDLLKLLLNKRSSKVIKRYLDYTREELFSGKLDSKLRLSKQITRNLEEYNVSLPHTRAAELLMKKGYRVRVGDKIPFIITGKRKEDVVPYTRFYKPKLERRHYLYIWENIIGRVLERLGIEDILLKPSKIEDFA